MPQERKNAKLAYYQKPTAMTAFSPANFANHEKNCVKFWGNVGQILYISSTVKVSNMNGLKG